MNPGDVRRLIDDSPMSRVQVAAIAVTVVLSALDGYDVLSVTFAAPSLSHAWHLGKAAVGVMLSSGLVGMAAGSLGLAPLADRFGRRPIVLMALALMIVGGLWSALSHSVGEIAASRVLTGLGIGVVVAVITPLSAEFSNLKWRQICVAAMAVGYPIGGVVGGLAAAALLPAYGWTSVFFVKSAVALLMTPAVLVFLPESPAFLLARGRPDALAKINALLSRCGHAAVSALPVPPAPGSSGYRALFARGMAATTLRLTLANGLYVMTVYYVLSWLPQLVADAGFKASTASLVSALANLVGAGGGLLLGVAARRFGLPRLVVGALLGLGLSTALFGFTPPSLPLLFAAAAVCGFFLVAGITGLYATVAATFTPQSRASGSGFVIGIGRATSATAPYIAGWMFAGGLSRAQVSLTFAGCALLAGGVLMLRQGAPAATASDATSPAS